MVKFLVGAVLGFLSGLGVGGGSLLLLWLTLVLGVPQEEARAMNLMFFVPCALAATIFRWKQSRPNWRLTLPAVGAALAGALLGNLLGPRLNMDILKKVLGVLFLATGVRELLHRPRE